MADFDAEVLTERLLHGEQLTEMQLSTLLSKITPIFDAEPNVIMVKPPTTIIGDIHGEYHDLLEALRICGRPPFTSYLFLGDLVDRGYYSVECAALVLLLKLQFPTKIYVIRGNHESREVTEVYGFYDEILRKYNSATLWKQFVGVFDLFPVAAIVNDSLFCIHAGLSPGFEEVSELNELFRKQEVPHDGVLADILWSDPDVRAGWGRSPRGAGYIFGQDITEAFLKKNTLKMIVRGHELVQDGYQFSHGQELVTIFGAPNYCYRSGNEGATMEIDENMAYSFVEYQYAPRRGDPTANWVPDYFL